MSSSLPHQASSFPPPSSPPRTVVPSTATTTSTTASPPSSSSSTSRLVPSLTSTMATSAPHTPQSHHLHHPHPHHPHLPTGHSIHSPAHSASGEPVQGDPQDAGGVHTPTSRGNILVPPPPSSSTTATPSDLLSVASRASSTSRPGSPSVPSSPKLHQLGHAVGSSNNNSNSHVGGIGSRPSRPTSPAQSPAATFLSSTTTTTPPSNNTGATPGSRSPNLNRYDQSFSSTTANPDLSASMHSSISQLDSSAVFERDVEFATEHLLTGSEAIDLAAAPVLSEVALAVTSNDASSPVAGHSNIVAAQSLDSTVLSSPNLPANAFHAHNDVYHSDDLAVGSGGATAIGGFALPTSAMSLSERLRRTSGAAHSSGGAFSSSSSAGGGGSGARPTSGDFSPPPSLSMSASATGSPISSTPGSPVQLMHGNHFGAASSTSGVPFSHTVPEHVLEPNSPILSAAAEGLLPSPPGSAASGVSVPGGKDVKRRLSMISYADIINSERLSDTHSGFSSPAPSSTGLSLSATALPHGSAGVGSAIYSPVTSPEIERPSPLDKALPTSSIKPSASRTDSSATETFHMPGQLPLHTPPAAVELEENHDVTPTSSSLKKDSSAWSVVEMGKALVGTAAGAVGGVFGTPEKKEGNANEQPTSERS